MPSLCQTPGAEYHIVVGERRVAVSLELPAHMASLDLNPDQAYLLQEQLHDALEQVMAPLFQQHVVTVTAPQIDAARAIVRRAEKAGLPVANGIRWIAGLGAPKQRKR